MKLHRFLIPAGMALLLSACGGGGGSDAVPAPPPAAGNEVPASAVASSMAYSKYAASLLKSETGTPLEVNAVTPPTSETEAPVAL